MPLPPRRRRDVWYVDADDEEFWELLERGLADDPEWFAEIKADALRHGFSGAVSRSDQIRVPRGETPEGPLR